MGANSQIVVAAPNKLTLSGSSVLQGCGVLWRGITLMPETLNPLAIPGGQLDMSNSTLAGAEVGILAQNKSKIRLVNNIFTNNYISLRVSGFVPFINFGNAAEFKDNTFSSNANYIAPSYDVVTSPLTAIHFTTASTFFIGQDFANPPTVTNTINKVRRGIMVDNSFGLGLYGLQISDLTGSVSFPATTDRVAVRINGSRNINVKYCNIFGSSSQTRPSYGIITFNNSGHKQIYHDNMIVVSGTRGIYVSGLPFAATEVDMQNNQITANFSCIEVDNFANGAGSRLFLNKNFLYPRNGRGFGLQNVSAPYSIHDNDVATTISLVSPASVFQCSGKGDVYKNRVNMATQNDIALSIFSLGFSNNCKIYENNFYGNSANPNNLFDSGINSATTNNIIYCCNNVDNTTYGTLFNFANNDVRFYTTQYGAHDSALYFQPAATLNAQMNTGNYWVGGTTNLDAYYMGDQLQAQNNAPFRTNPNNINSSKILPAGWFFLFGTDPSCAEASTITCDDLELPTEYTELTPDDLAALAAANYDNEDALRFVQKRQLYRKLKENPSLTSWDSTVTSFYNASQNNIIGDMYEVDEAWRILFGAAAATNASYTALINDLDDLNEQVADIYANYPGATVSEQEAMLDDLNDAQDQILALEEEIKMLAEDESDEFGQRLDDLLALNAALSTTEVWEEAEKDINDLLFRYSGKLIDSFSSAQQNQIIALAEECPQYYGAGVYKARFLREQFEGTSRRYVESNCMGEERSDASVPKIEGSSSIAVQPNPASERVLVTLPVGFPDGGMIEIRNLQGTVIASHRFTEGIFGQTLDVSRIPSGIFWLTVKSEGWETLFAKLAITR